MNVSMGRSFVPAAGSVVSPPRKNVSIVDLTNYGTSSSGKALNGVSCKVEKERIRSAVSRRKVHLVNNTSIHSTNIPVPTSPRRDLAEQKVKEIDVNLQDQYGFTKLFKTAGRGNVTLVKELIKKGADVNIKNLEGNTPLLFALGRGYRDVALLLIESGADINVKDRYRNTPLILAVCGGQTSVVTKLLELHAHTDVIDRDGFPLLFLAVANGDPVLFKQLLKAGAVLDLKAKYNDRGCSCELSRLPSQRPAVVRRASTHISDSYYTLLYFAVAKGLTDVGAVLLTSGEMAIAVDEETGTSLLHLSIERGRTHTALMLIERCTEGLGVTDSEASSNIATTVLEVVDKAGDTPLTIAAKENCVDVVLKLLEHGADVNAKDKTGVTSLPQAITKGHEEIALILIEAGADVAAKNKLGISPLLLAVELNREEVAFKLIESGADLLAKNKRQYTPLHLAISSAFFDIAVKLLEAGASLHSKEWRNNKPFDLFATESLKRRFFMEADFPNRALVNNNHDLWFYLIQLSDMKGIERRVLHFAQNNPDLARAKDGNGRVAADIATKESKHAIQSIFLWHGRYRVIEGRPEHTSATCFVYRAVDEEDRDESNHPKRVALKLMRYKSQFLRELKARQFGFDSEYVVNVIATYPTYDATTGTVLMKPSVLPVSPKANKVLRRSMIQLPGGKRDFSGVDASIESMCDAKTLERNRSMPVGESPSAILAAACANLDETDATALLRGRTCKRASDVFPSAFRNSPLFVGKDYEPKEDAWESNHQEEDEINSTEFLTKKQAERLFCIVMPQADRNMFVALKQERFAGSNMDEVKHIFTQLVKCVEHLHSKGVVHGDIKTLNLVRTGAQWKLIDLDASCVIGIDAVGFKSSSSYVPPEAIFVDKERGFAMARSNIRNTDRRMSFEINTLIADPSFDVWSLGCVLYQLSTPDVRPLFQGGQDDNLSDDTTDDDNLFVLSEWTNQTKNKKLSKVTDPLARNLLSQILHRNPTRRPTIPRILAHPFLSSKKVARLAGEHAAYDVFLSYRVNSDAHHAEKLYNMLTERGVKVWWDKTCLVPGVDWKEGFCAGLCDSRTYVCLLSRESINHPTVFAQSFRNLNASSPCDHVYLEMRLAIELKGLGMIDKIFPVFCGEYNAKKKVFEDFFGTGGLPAAPAVAVGSVERDLKLMMDLQCLGTPLVPDRTVSSVLSAITACHGAKIDGDGEIAFTAAVGSICQMLTISKKNDEREWEDRHSEGFSTPDRSHSLPESIGSSGRINLENLLTSGDEKCTLTEGMPSHAELLSQIEELKKNEEILSNEIRSVVAKERKLAKVNSALRDKAMNWKTKEDRLEQEIWLLKKMVVLHSNEKKLASASSLDGIEHSAAMRQCHSLSPMNTPKVPRSPPRTAGYQSVRSNCAYLRPNNSGTILSSQSAYSSMCSSPRPCLRTDIGIGESVGEFPRGRDGDREKEKDREVYIKSRLSLDLIDSERGEEDDDDDNILDSQDEGARERNKEREKEWEKEKELLRSIGRERDKLRLKT